MNLPSVFLLVILGVVSSKDHAVSEVSDSSVNFHQLKSNQIGIYNGNFTTMDSLRYLVVIQKEGEFHCTGCIVSESWVLTTADCTSRWSAEQLTVMASSDDGETGKIYDVAQVVEHPEYGPGIMDYDYSCVQIVGKFYYWAKRSHLLPTAAPLDYMTFSVAGYGFTSANSTEMVLSKAVMRWLPTSYCESMYQGYDFEWTDRMACADSTDKATLCGGDYGDSFVVGQVVFGQFLGGAKSGFCTSWAKPVILSNIFTEAAWIHEITGAQYA